MSKDEIRRKQQRESKQRQRVDEEHRSKERLANQDRMRLARQDTEQAEKERLANQERMRLARQDTEQAEKERQANKERMLKAREQDGETRAKERLVDRLNKRSWRANLENRRREQQLNTLAHFGSRHSKQALIIRYEDTIKQGPTIVCTCCGGLFFAHYMEPLEEKDLGQFVGEDTLQRVQCVPAVEGSQPPYFAKTACAT